MDNNQISFIKADTIELHYGFNDATHSMDAVIQNKCEFELLGILKETASVFNIEIIIETEPLAEGDLKRLFKIISKNENKTAVITTAIITSFAASVILHPLGTTFSEIGKQLVTKIFEDERIKELEDEKKELENEKLKEEIKNIKYDTELKIQQISQNNKIAKRKSNFYEALNKYPKVEVVSLIIEDEHKNPISEELTIHKNIFKDFIIISDELEPLLIDNAIIEIISPVLKKGEYKWRGIYNGETLSFNMKSNEFKTLVQTGKIEFKNGSSIKCLLEIKRRMDSDGYEKNTDYDIIRVNEYFENDKPIETPEGKRHKQKQEAEKLQLNHHPQRRWI